MDLKDGWRIGKKRTIEKQQMVGDEYAAAVDAAMKQKNVCDHVEILAPYSFIAKYTGEVQRDEGPFYIDIYTSIPKPSSQKL